ncbi:DUF5305 domain-containing protein [Halomarina litorea]|uniref:DUF5305 domain-containing protein n=1 Tax=Halomarina litorea TaxID=2961595 RepID=UPI0020C4DC95|nr:DUF5305 domain-containing protein [Halomarina sp. BCD28]
MSDWTLRAQRYVEAYLPVVVVALVVLGLLGGWLTYTGYATPGTHEETLVESTWTERTAFDHHATVTEPNRLYEVGTTLHNQSAYFTAIAPVLNGSFAYTYGASDSGSLSADVRTVLVLQSVDRERGGNTTVYWRRTEPLGGTQVAGLSPGERVAVPFSVNVSAAQNRTELITEDLGGTVGQVEAVVRARIDVEGTVNGEQVDRTVVRDLPLELGTAYRIAGNGSASERFADERTVVVPNEPGPVERFGGPAFLLASLLLLGTVAVTARDDEFGLSAEERERLGYAGDRAEFDEWITRIRLPETVLDRPRAEADSLADLVDFAIDTDSGVVEDPDGDAYYVVHDDLLYVYEPPTTGAEKRAGERGED